MTVREVAHGTPQYDALVELRRRVLRLPLGLDFMGEELAGESDQRHFGLYDGTDRPMAVCAVAPKGSVWKVRQVAVEPEAQGKGYGAFLMRALEAHAEEFVLHARESVVPFYLRLGYKVEGDPFEEVGIPHRAMSKELG
ncbi:GNAT family N-acetyltransferase [bacterium]|nr:MAG: GNAT family N-acetyltransferase [bacterium]